MKTYKNSEAIAMLEKNPNTKFECPGGYTLLVEDERITIKNYSIPEKDYGFYLDDEWTLIPNEYSFKVAVNSGKKIKPVSLANEKSFYPYTYWLGFMVSNIEHGKKPLDLINDKWYVEEE